MTYLFIFISLTTKTKCDEQNIWAYITKHLDWQIGVYFRQKCSTFAKLMKQMTSSLKYLKPTTQKVLSIMKYLKISLCYIKFDVAFGSIMMCKEVKERNYVNIIQIQDIEQNRNKRIFYNGMK